LNAIAGVSGWAVAGPLAVSVKGEYQHAPFADALPLNVRTIIGAPDRLPVAPATPFQQIDRFRLIDATVSLNVNNWQFSFGKQSLWWGPGNTTALTLTNNAEAFTMLRLSRTSPSVLPGFAKILGPVRVEYFVGRLEGHNFVYEPPIYTTLIGSYDKTLDPQPYIHGEKFSMKPTENLEIGVSLTAIFGGPGVPVTTKNFLRTFHNFSTGPFNNGDRKTGFQFSYRIPGLRNWLTLYNDSIAEDEPNPIAYPRRSAMNPGIYLSHVPYVPKLDLRVEAAYTDLPNMGRTGMYYTDVRFIESYTNNGNIMGSWIGRDGRSVQSVATYWFAPQKTIRFGFRHMDVQLGLIPSGGSLNDVSASTDWVVRPSLTLRGSLQFERWNFPDLAPSSKHNIGAVVEMVFRPNWSIH
jgi:hypothetical protein